MLPRGTGHRAAACHAEQAEPRDRRTPGFSANAARNIPLRGQEPLRRHIIKLASGKCSLIGVPVTSRDQGKARNVPTRGCAKDDEVYCIRAFYGPGVAAVPGAGASDRSTGEQHRPQEHKPERQGGEDSGGYGHLREPPALRLSSPLSRCVHAREGSCQRPCQGDHHRTEMPIPTQHAASTRRDDHRRAGFPCRGGLRCARLAEEGNAECLCEACRGESSDQREGGHDNKNHKGRYRGGGCRSIGNIAEDQQLAHEPVQRGKTKIAAAPTRNAAPVSGMRLSSPPSLSNFPHSRRINGAGAEQEP